MKEHRGAVSCSIIGLHNHTQLSHDRPKPENSYNLGGDAILTMLAFFKHCQSTDDPWARNARKETCKHSSHKSQEKALNIHGSTQPETEVSNADFNSRHRGVWLVQLAKHVILDLRVRSSNPCCTCVGPTQEKEKKRERKRKKKFPSHKVFLVKKKKKVS